ncbi:amidase [Craterilacuibacter sp. RT1T]|uniref:amidase n=1 Tax=Craterilacuibacter sp. RT1T TaxID=2942211 RepID=UPI0020BE7C23|nr:amidase [Craterilacuibacter sp. RT1T]MCL6262687.1 amidase [Craterilacuibacter sp. RT1T]
MKPSKADNPTRRSVLCGALAAGVSALFPRPARAAGSGGLSMADYLALDATAMAEGVTRGDFSASELLDAALARCDALNGTVNAVVLRHDERARTLAATSPAGALAGVPLLVKDLNTHIAGTVTSNGSRLFAGRISPLTSTLIERWEQAGMVGFAKSASPEFGLTPTTESQLWGATRNPWDLARSAGGSSGGAAAAVAAGIVPVAHATDGGGSIRIPAAHCGLFGLKPSRYRTPQGPGRFEGWFGASVGHALTRSVRDSALMLDIAQGHEPGSPYWASPLARPYREEARRQPGRLRVALVEESLTRAPLDADTRAALQNAARLLETLGHHVEPAVFPVDAQLVFGAQGVVTRTALRTAVLDRERELARPMGKEELEPVTRELLAWAASLSAEDLFRARQNFEEVSRKMEGFFGGFDVILSPVTSTIAPPLGALALTQPMDDYTRAATAAAGFTVVANIGGQPSMSVPLYRTAGGLPVGSLFTARLGAEALLFRLAAQLERAAPWPTGSARL